MTTDYNVPFFLRPYDDSMDFQMKSLTDPTQPLTHSGGELKTFWHELAEIPDAAGDFLSDTYDSAKSGIANIVESGTDTFKSYLSWVEGKLIFVLLILVGVVWVVAKSGIITQVAALK